jgi:hypothetical protein
VLSTLLAWLVVAPSRRQARPTTAGGGRGAVGFDLEPRVAAGAPQPKLRDGLLSPPPTRRLAAVRVLLERLHDFDPLRSGDGDTFRAGALLLAPHEPACQLGRSGTRCTCVLSALAELERLLLLMRVQRPKQFGHLHARYIARTQVLRDLPVRRRNKRGKTVRVFERCLVDLYPAWVRAEVVRRGVACLAASWDLRDLRGELVEPWLFEGLDVAAPRPVGFADSSPRAL